MSEGRERYAVLLASLVAAFVIQGVAEPAAWEQVLVSGLLAVTLLLAFRAARVRLVVMRSAVAVAVAVVAISAAGAATGHVDNATSRIADLLLVTLAPPAIVVGVVRTLRARTRLRSRRCWGGVPVHPARDVLRVLYGAIGRLSGCSSPRGTRRRSSGACTSASRR
jgi:hypothetical protein